LMQLLFAAFKTVLQGR